VPNDRKLLVVGAGPFQLPLIEKGKELGYRVYAVSNVQKDPGLRAADYGLNISILDFDALEKLCRQERITAVVTGASDLGTFAVGHLNDVLGLPGLSAEQVRSVSDKGRFIRLQEKLDLPRPESFRIHTRDDLEAALQDISTYPVILKPLHASGSRGIRVAHDPAGVRGAHDFVQRHSFLRKGYVLQTYLDAVEYGGECLVEAGKVVFLQMTHKFLNEGHVPLGHCVPCHPPDGVQRAVAEQIESIAAHLGVEHAPVNIDVMISPDRPPILIDLSFRLGGNLLPRLMREKFGCDTFRRVIEYCDREQLPPLGNLEETPGTFGAIIFGSSTAGILTAEMKDRTTRLFRDASRIVELVFDLSVGDAFERFDQGSHRFGHALFEVESLEAYGMLLKDTTRALDYHT